jgi:hypothetical protein
MEGVGVELKAAGGGRQGAASMWILALGWILASGWSRWWQHRGVVGRQGKGEVLARVSPAWRLLLYCPVPGLRVYLQKL